MKPNQKFDFARLKGGKEIDALQHPTHPTTTSSIQIQHDFIEDKTYVCPVYALLKKKIEENKSKKEQKH